MAGTSLCTCLYAVNIHRRQVHFRSLDRKWTCLSTIVSRTTAFTAEVPARWWNEMAVMTHAAVPDVLCEFSFSCIGNAHALEGDTASRGSGMSVSPRLSTRNARAFGGDSRK